jgi:hypothetical protein
MNFFKSKSSVDIMMGNPDILTTKHNAWSIKFT